MSLNRWPPATNGSTHAWEKNTNAFQSMANHTKMSLSPGAYLISQEDLWAGCLTELRALPPLGLQELPKQFPSVTVIFDTLLARKNTEECKTPTTWKQLIKSHCFSQSLGWHRGWWWRRSFILSEPAFHPHVQNLTVTPKTWLFPPGYSYHLSVAANRTCWVPDG